MSSSVPASFNVKKKEAAVKAAKEGSGGTKKVEREGVGKSREDLRDISGVEIAEMDLSDLNSVRDFSDTLKQNESKLDLLINNAGIMACPEARVGNNWESQFAVNHLGHFVLTTELLPLLIAADSGRVVSLLSSTGPPTVKW